MKLIEQLLDLVTSFTLKRAFSLAFIMGIVLGACWVVDSYTNYTAFHRIERAVTLLERLDSLERKGQSSARIEELRQTLSSQLFLLSERPNEVVATEVSLSWLPRAWPKMSWGALPWFLVSLLAFWSLWGKDKHAWPTFFALQFFTVAFAFVNLAIPDVGRFWIDRLLMPWGVFVVCTVIPMSISGVAAFRKVRGDSLERIIINNLRQVAAASDLFRLEHGRDPEGLDELLGEEKYIKKLVSVDGEKYEMVDLRLGRPLIVIRKSGQAVKYEKESG